MACSGIGTGFGILLIILYFWEDIKKFIKENNVEPENQTESKNQEYVDSNNMSVVGLSLGGGIVQGMSIIEPEIKSIVIASGLVSFHKTVGTGTTPGMLKFFDFPDLVASLAPKPIYLSWGENEKSNFGFEAKSLYSANIVKNAYSVINAEQNVVIVIHNDEFNNGHTFDVDSIIKFLKNTLGEPRI